MAKLYRRTTDCGTENVYTINGAHTTSPQKLQDITPAERIALMRLNIDRPTLLISPVYALILLHKPQRHWHPLLSSWDVGGPNRHLYKHYYPPRTGPTRLFPRERSTIQHSSYGARLPYDLLYGNAPNNWRLRELTYPPYVSRPRYSLPPTK